VLFVKYTSAPQPLFVFCHAPAVFLDLGPFHPPARNALRNWKIAIQMSVKGRIDYMGISKISYFVIVGLCDIFIVPFGYVLFDVPDMPQPFNTLIIIGFVSGLTSCLFGHFLWLLLSVNKHTFVALPIRRYGVWIGIRCLLLSFLLVFLCRPIARLFLLIVLSFICLLDATIMNWKRHYGN